MLGSGPIPISRNGGGQVERSGEQLCEVALVDAEDTTEVWEPPPSECSIPPRPRIVQRTSSTVSKLEIIQDGSRERMPQPAFVRGL